jgi:hypothetical protein
MGIFWQHFRCTTSAATISGAGRRERPALQTGCGDPKRKGMKCGQYRPDALRTRAEGWRYEAAAVMLQAPRVQSENANGRKIEEMSQQPTGQPCGNFPIGARIRIRMMRTADIDLEGRTGMILGCLAGVDQMVRYNFRLDIPRRSGDRTVSLIESCLEHAPQRGGNGAARSA